MAAARCNVFFSPCMCMGVCGCGIYVNNSDTQRRVYFRDSILFICYDRSYVSLQNKVKRNIHILKVKLKNEKIYYPFILKNYSH